MSGYVRIHRSLIGHPAFRNDAEAMAFAWLVARAQWKPTRVRYKERGIQLDRGQLAISVRDFATAMDRDKAWVERLLKRLRAETMVETRHETGVTVITICKYNEYQPSGVPRETVAETLGEAFTRQTQDTEQVREEGKEGSEANASQAAVVSAWNAMAEEVGLPKIRTLNTARKQALKLREKEFGAGATIEAIGIVRRSEWLRGEGRNGTWRPTIDFLLQPSSLLKVLEGAYGGVEQARAEPTVESRADSLKRSIALYESSGRHELVAQARQMLAELEKPPDRNVTSIIHGVAKARAA